MRRSRRALGHGSRFGTIGCALAIAVSAQRTAVAETVALRAEMGAEYDSNVHRAVSASGAATPAPVSSPLGRFVLGWSAADKLGDRHDVSFSLLGAAKTFTAAEARGENVGVVETSGLWRMRASERTRVLVAGSYYEAIQAGTSSERELSGNARDFRSLTSTLRVARTLGAAGVATVGGGYRFFTYKPAAAYDFTAPVAAAEYRLAWETDDQGAEWEAVASGNLEWRRFAGTRLVPVTPCTGVCAEVDPTGVKHNDRFWTGQIEITRTGAVLLGVGYGIQWNDSNSYGILLLRHVGIFRLTASLPFGFYLAARAELVYVPPGYRLNVPAEGPSTEVRATIEDENRNLGSAELSRDLGPRLQILARYSLYENAFGEESSRYRRQTGTVSLVFSVD